MQRYGWIAFALSLFTVSAAEVRSPDTEAELRKQHRALAGAVAAQGRQGLDKAQTGPGAAYQPTVFGASAGCNGPIRVSARRDRLLILGGEFTVCADQIAAGVVAYDLDTGQYAGFGSGISGEVRALLIDGKNLYVGGLFSHAGGQAASNIARWDGSQWQSLGPATSPGANRAVNGIALYEGAIYAGGEFTEIGGVVANHVARWQAGQWTPMGSKVPGGGVDQTVLALIEFEQRLIVGGQFRAADGEAADLVAAWDGQWSPIAGFPLTPGDQSSTETRRLRVIRGQLYAVGSFGVNPQGGPISQIQRLAGEQWLTDGGIWTETVADIAEWRGQLMVLWQSLVYSTDPLAPVLLMRGAEGLLSLDEQLLVTGDIAKARIHGQNGVVVGPAMCFDGGTMRPLSAPRINGTVLATLATEEGIYVGGDFSQLAGQDVGHVARWNGASWEALGSGSENGTDGPVRALASVDGLIYVGGSFKQAGGQPANLISTWDGSQWHAPNGGLWVDTYPEQMYVAGIRQFQGQPLVYGRFSGGVARWEGGQWRSGLSDQAYGSVGYYYSGFCLACPRIPEIHAAAEYRGELYLGGRFTIIRGAPTPAEIEFVQPFVRWDGGRFRAIRNVDPERLRLFPVRSLASFADELLIAGAQDADHVGISRWDGIQLGPVLPPCQSDSLEVGCRQSVQGMLAIGSRLLLSGSLHTGEGARPNQVVQWNGADLQPAGPQYMSTRVDYPYSKYFDLRGPHLGRYGEHPLVGDLPYARFPSVSVESQTTDGQPGTQGSNAPALSTDGRTLAFVSAAPNLPSLFPGTSRRIFLRDRPTGRLQAVSDLVVAAGVSDSGVSFAAPSVSAHGQAIAFDGDDGQVYALVGNRPQRVSRSASGAPGDAPSWGASVSAGGDSVAFISRASNLLKNSNGRAQAYVRDLASGELMLVSVGADGKPANGDSTEVVVAADASVVFIADAIDLAAAGGRQIYRSVQTADGRRLSCITCSMANATSGLEDISGLRITPDGRYGVFVTSAAISADDRNGLRDIYWFEFAAEELIAIERVSVSTYRLEANADSAAPSISDDGQLIAFQSTASNLIELDHNGSADVFVHFRASGETRRVNATVDGLPPAAASSGSPALSGDGSTLAFATSAENFGASNGRSQVVTTIFASPRRRRGFSGDDLPSLEHRPLPLPFAGNPNCPGGYFTAVIDDGLAPGIKRGHWGMELLLEASGNRLLEGGLNFGSLIDPAQPGFAGFNIANAQSEPQLLNLELTGNGHEGASAPISVRVELQDQNRQNLYDSGAVELRRDRSHQHSLTVTPGYYTLVVTSLDTDPAGAQATGQFFLSATTRYTDRVGGGFQGGVVVGGYHDRLSADGISGYAGFCVSQPEQASARLVSLTDPPLPEAAGDLRLRLLDADGVAFGSSR